MQHQETEPLATRVCDAGHQMYLSKTKDRTRFRCSECANKPRTKEERAIESARRRQLRAKMKAEQPERYSAIMKAARERAKIRVGKMSGPEYAEYLASQKRRNKSRNERERLANALNVPVYVYNDFLRENDLTEDEMVKDSNRPSAPWNLLKVKGDAIPVWDEFSRQLETTVTPCQGSTKWTEYDDPRPGHEDENTGTAMPTRGQARMWCASCPLLEICGEFAAKDKPDFGIFGGRLFLGGKAI